MNPSDGLFRRILNLLGIGRTRTPPIESGTIAKAQISISGLQTRDETSIFQSFGFASSLPVGTDVVFACVSGDPSNGMVIANNNQAYRPKNMATGESQQYDAFGKSIYLTKNGGIVVNANGSAVTVNNATLVTINASTKVRMVTPRLEVTGDIIDNCDTQSHTVANMRTIYDGHTHPVTGSTTQPPNQQE